MVPSTSISSSSAVRTEKAGSPASGVVRSDVLVAGNTPQHLERTWEVTADDIRWADALYPLAQHAMQRGYYMPNRNSRHCSRHECPYWRRCEQDFGGVVEA